MDILYLKPYIDLISPMFMPVVAGVSCYFAIQRWQQEKNRELHQKRITIYAKLLGYIIQQEEIRRLYLVKNKQFKYDNVPVLSKTNVTKSLEWPTLRYKVIKEEKGNIHRDNFITILQDENAGFISPTLLILLNEYKILVECHDSIMKVIYPDYRDGTAELRNEILNSNKGQELQEIAEKMKTLEKKFIPCIINDYNNSIKYLGIDKEIIDLNDLVNKND